MRLPPDDRFRRSCKPWIPAQLVEIDSSCNSGQIKHPTPDRINDSISGTLTSFIIADLFLERDRSWRPLVGDRPAVGDRPRLATVPPVLATDIPL